MDNILQMNIDTLDKFNKIKLLRLLNLLSYMDLHEYGYKIRREADRLICD